MFKFYKFCQSPIITMLLVVSTVHIALHEIYSMSVWITSLIGIVIFAIGIFPLLGAFYFFTFGAVMAISNIAYYVHLGSISIILISILAIHIIRSGYQMWIAIKHPDLSLAFDKAIRYGGKF